MYAVPGYPVYGGGPMGGPMSHMTLPVDFMPSYPYFSTPGMYHQAPMPIAVEKPKPWRDGMTLPVEKEIKIPVSSPNPPQNAPSKQVSEEDASKTNLFVRNLPRVVDDAMLSGLFSPYGTIVSSVVMRNIHTGESLGTGFVRFESFSEAQAAMKAMHNFVHPRGNVLDVQWAKKQHDATLTETSKKSVKKLFVRNIPLNVSQAELSRLFEVYGTVKKIVVHSDTAGAPGGPSQLRQRGVAQNVSHPQLPRRVEERYIVFIIYAQEGAAARAAEAVHNTMPFPSCNGVALMAKLAEDSQQRRTRRGTAVAGSSGVRGKPQPVTRVISTGEKSGVSSGAASSSGANHDSTDGSSRTPRLEVVNFLAPAMQPAGDFLHQVRPTAPEVVGAAEDLASTGPVIKKVEETEEDDRVRASPAIPVITVTDNFHMSPMKMKRVASVSIAEGCWSEEVACGCHSAGANPAPDEYSGRYSGGGGGGGALPPTGPIPITRIQSMPRTTHADGGAVDAPRIVGTDSLSSDNHGPRYCGRPCSNTQAGPCMVSHGESLRSEFEGITIRRAHSFQCQQDAAASGSSSSNNAGVYAPSPSVLQVPMSFAPYVSVSPVSVRRVARTLSSSASNSMVVSLPCQPITPTWSLRSTVNATAGDGNVRRVPSTAMACAEGQTPFDPASSTMSGPSQLPVMTGNCFATPLHVTRVHATPSVNSNTSALRSCHSVHQPGHPNASFSTAGTGQGVSGIIGANRSGMHRMMYTRSPDHCSLMSLHFTASHCAEVSVTANDANDAVRMSYEDLLRVGDGAPTPKVFRHNPYSEVPSRDEWNSVPAIECDTVQ